MPRKDIFLTEEQIEHILSNSTEKTKHNKGISAWVRDAVQQKIDKEKGLINVSGLKINLSGFKFMCNNGDCADVCCMACEHKAECKGNGQLCIYLCEDDITVCEHLYLKR